VTGADAANAADHAAAALESAIADLAEARTRAARDLAELRAQFVAADDRAEQAESQSRTDLDAMIEYHRELEQALEVADGLRAELSAANARLAELGEPTVQWGVEHGSLGVLDASANEAAIRQQAARHGREIRRRIVGEWLCEDGTVPPPVCPRCHGSRKVPDWTNWNTEYGEPRPKPCPDCAVNSGA
jgi:hypothetical protein